MLHICLRAKYSGTEFGLNCIAYFDDRSLEYAYKEIWISVFVSDYPLSFKPGLGHKTGGTAIAVKQ